jgi:RNA polymerase sigma-70 factor, ECF subfamily
MQVGALASVGPVPLDIETIYRTHAAAVARWAARLAGPELEPEDVVQEVFLIAQRKLRGFRGEASPARWLYRITERVVAHRRRRLRWRRYFVADAGAAAERVAAPGPTPLDSAQSREAEGLFYRALEGMNENHRTAFVLFELEQMSGQEIATLKGVTAATVWVWLHRARARFLARLQELEQAEPPAGRPSP